jgi:hypothetical protein
VIIYSTSHRHEPPRSIFLITSTLNHPSTLSSTGSKLHLQCEVTDLWNTNMRISISRRPQGHMPSTLLLFHNPCKATLQPNSTNMLRRRLSSGLLRAQLTPIANHTAIPAVPALPARYATSNRGLASAVLLSSRENWASKTVKNLKEALAQRGLSQ